MDGCQSHTGGTRASIVPHLATCQWFIKAEQEKKSNKRDNASSKTQSEDREAGESRLERKEFHCKQVGEWKNHIIIL